MLVSVVCEGVRVRVHVYWTEVVVVVKARVLRCPRPLESLDAGERVGPGSRGAHADHRAGGAGRTGWARRTG